MTTAASKSGPAISVRRLVESVHREAGKRAARKTLRATTVITKRGARGEYDAASAVIERHVGVHGAPAAWSPEQWRALGRRLGAAGLRWDWSSVVVEVSGRYDEVESRLRTQASFYAASLPAAGPCWKADQR